MARPAPVFRIEFPPELPISARAGEIVDLIGQHQVLILAGETGSGKTTQIPKMCLAAGRGREGRIACTQPRRVAALSVSRRVAEELAVPWGGPVGCKVRFDDQTSRDTVIKFMTDGMLLAEVQGDPLLRAYDTIIVDEAHERSLNIDFLLGHLRNLRHRRPELKIIITSATIDTQVFAAAFDGAPIVEVSGRTHPVEVIYAPLDEVDAEEESFSGSADADTTAGASGGGSGGSSGEKRAVRAEALHYVEGAVAAATRIIESGAAGDLLVFLPSERDIREARELLEGRRLPQTEVIPLFGRLTAGEQQRVFAPTQRRKLILATNIAETSLTLPGIRFVIDTGLSRVSRYVAQARTRRLPIEPVAQSSADQRKGRAGRVAAGVCIRLYTEEDFNARPRFAQPEIQRANLADVILRLKAFGLGDIERFPFINMPAAKAISAGYALLEELGALEPTGSDGVPGSVTLSAVGAELARLPVDPTVGRMILQARVEKAVREVVVIAAGLSIQDPRERPMDKQAQADAAHRRFAHPDSDFLSLLKLWDAYHDDVERLSQSRLRRFCKDHFLSFTRMREWRDVHAQLMDALGEREDLAASSVFAGCTPAQYAEQAALPMASPGYRAIHRSILAGLLGNIALRDEEHGGYRATHERRVALFPGSALFVREDPRKQNAQARPPAANAPAATRAPRWVMAAEIMETSRLYARVNARLDPQWALELGRHLLKISHGEPFWNEEGGRIQVRRRTRLYGLELEVRAVSYGPVNPVHATELFIREGLVNDTITWPLPFLEHNRAVREEVESLLTRTRDRGYLHLDEALYQFYADRLLPKNPGDPAISSVAELVALVRARSDADPRFLQLVPEDLHDPARATPDPAAYPVNLPLAQSVLPLAYAYKPGQPEDGVTLEIHARAAEDLTAAALDWAVPGHLAAVVEHHLRSLPKEHRVRLQPFKDKLTALTRRAAQLGELRGRAQPLVEVLAEVLREELQAAIDPRFWLERPPPDHLRVRIRVVDDEGAELCASRSVDEVRTALAAWRRAASERVASDEPAAWRQARARWETPEQTTWTWGEIPAAVPVCERAGVVVEAFPALVAGRAGVALRLVRTRAEAVTLNAAGLSRLLEHELSHELTWLHKDLRELRTLGALLATFAPLEKLQNDAHDHLRRWLCDAARVDRATPAGTALGALTQAAFAGARALARQDLAGAVTRMVEVLREILTLRQALLVHTQPPPRLADELVALVPASILTRVDWARLGQLPRYLKALKIRADRWRQNPGKDAERMRQFLPYARLLNGESGEALRWWAEEYRVSLFAQELGTPEPVSATKLDRLLAEVAAGRPVAAPGLGGGVGVAPLTAASSLPTAAERTAAAPKAPTASTLAARPVTPDKKTTVKSLGALDALFRK